MMANHRGFYLSLASTNSLNRIRHSREFRFFYHIYVIEERGGVMNISKWIDVFLAICRLIFYIVEVRKARRGNGGPEDTS